MSSLGLSLLLLVALAVAVALVYNLRQARPRLRWPGELRWPALRHGKSGKAEARPTTRRVEPQPVREAGDASGQRGEPRLGADAPDAPVGVAPPDAHDWPAVPARDVAPAPRRVPAEGEAAGLPVGAATASGAPAGGTDRARARDRAGHGAAPATGPGTTDGVTDRTTAGPAPEPPAAAAIAAVAAVAEQAATPAGPRAPAARAPAPRLSEICDCIVEMPLPSACAGERLAAIAQRFRRAGSKPVTIEGLPVDAQPGGWEALSAARHYGALRVGILIANRHGPLNAMEFSEFVAGVQAIAESLAALADTPDMVAVLARARDLDATCAQLDAQVGVNVETPEALGPAQLAALAGALSVIERGSNRYARVGAQGDVVFSVALADVPNRLTFLLDVPRTMPDADAWGQMLEAANACARRVGGRLVDDGGRPLAESALTQIGRQLAQRYESLEAIGLPAGSALALRVFN
ncbi:MAG: cell division protein ZipA C-terminal FtsZ-binding domain-containing protein [Burkholderiaceae bacterium]